MRICAVKFLCLLDGSNMSHKLFMEDLAIKLLDKVNMLYFTLNYLWFCILTSQNPTFALYVDRISIFKYSLSRKKHEIYGPYF